MFPVYYEEAECGSAIVEKEGLYCRIRCRCRIPTKVPCKITLNTAKDSINLGTCIKMGDTYIVDTKVPSKYIDGQSLRFRVLLPDMKEKVEFFPVREDMPFPHLHKLHKARMCRSKDLIGVIFIE